MSVRFNNLIPMLLCRDVQASIRFYVDVLGFEVVDRMDNVGRTGFASLRNGRTKIMLASPTYVPENPKLDGRYTQSVYYFYPDDVEALHAQVKVKGREPSDLKVRFYGLKEFELVDPDGHVLLFGQDTDEPVTPE